MKNLELTVLDADNNEVIISLSSCKYNDCLSIKKKIDTIDENVKVSEIDLDELREITLNQAGINQLIRVLCFLKKELSQ